MFLVMLLDKPLAKTEVKLFSTSKSFYTMTGWLSKRELIKSSVIDEKGTKLYKLSMRGEILAMALDNLVKDTEYASIMKFRKLDERRIDLRKLLLGDK